jgi:uncharacterized protein (UPF0210 family)
MHCDMPKKPTPVVSKCSQVKAKPPVKVLTEEKCCEKSNATNQSTSVNAAPVVNVRVNVVPPKQNYSIVSRQQTQTRYRLVDKKSTPLAVFAIAGTSPSRYKVSSTNCDIRLLQCSADIKRRWVFDAGVGILKTVDSGLTFGIVGTFQGSGYVALGYSFN